jgi:hypothetical protein
VKININSENLFGMVINNKFTVGKICRYVGACIWNKLVYLKLTSEVDLG